MRKQINSTSKRKWIVGGAIFFGSVALLTTGFATWTVGVTQTTGNKDVNVTVDTAENQSVFLELGALSDDSIKLMETAQVSNGVMVNAATDTDYDADALKITIASIKVTIGGSVSTAYSKLVFSIEELGDTTTYANDLVYVGASADLIGSAISGRTGEKWSYIEAPADLLLSSGAYADANNIKTYTFAATTLEFQWGSFFNNMSPANFYNAKFNSQSDSVRVAQTGNVTSELNAMHDALNGKTIQLKVTLE